LSEKLDNPLLISKIRGTSPSKNKMPLLLVTKVRSLAKFEATITMETIDQ
jgi:hypothetical protein